MAVAAGAAGTSRRLLLVGLCNEGMGGTRHSVGAALVEHLAGVWGLGPLAHEKAAKCDVATGAVPAAATTSPSSSSSSSAAAAAAPLQPPVLLARPRGFMNVCGRPVAALLRAVAGRAAPALPLDALLVAHDDLDLPLGRWAWKDGGSARGHNGVRSVGEAAGSLTFARLRIGIGRPPAPADVPDYVLGRFSAAERRVLHEAVLPGVAAEVAAAAARVAAGGPVIAAAAAAPSQQQQQRQAGRKRTLSALSADGGGGGGDGAAAAGAGGPRRQPSLPPSTSGSGAGTPPSPPLLPPHR